MRCARQSLVNQSGDHELVKRFNELFTGLCHVAVERLDLDFVNPAELVTYNEEREVIPKPSRLDEPRDPSSYSDRLTLHNAIMAKLKPLTKATDLQGDSKMQGPPPIKAVDVLNFVGVCNMLENFSFEHEVDLARKRIKALRFEVGKTHKLWQELRLLTWVVTGQCQTDQYIYEEFVKLLPEGPAKHLRLFESTIRPDGVYNVKLISHFVDDHVRAHANEPIAHVAAVAAERAAVVDEDLEDCTNAILNALRQARSQRTQKEKNFKRGSGSESTDRSFASELASLVAKHRLCRNCFKEGHVARNCKDSFNSEDLFKAQTAYSRNQSSKPKARLSQYSSVVFAKAALDGCSNKSRARWLVDLGSQVSALDSKHPLAASIKWKKPRIKLSAANNSVLLVRGEAQATLAFKGGVRRTTTLYCVEGLNVDAVIGTDILLQTGRIALAMQEATGHGVMSLGRGSLIPVETPDGSEMSVRAIRAGLKSYALRLVAKSRQTRKVPEPKVTIGRTPVLCTLEENTNEPGQTKQKVGKAEVTVNPDLTAEQRSRVDKLLAERRGAFANNEEEVGVAKGFHFNIDLIDKNPVTSGKHRRVPYHIRDELTEALLKIEKQGIIRRSNSPYCSGLVIVRKPDGSLRICVHYKDLNAKTADDGYQLPLVEDQMNRLSGSKFFTALDLFRGYHQLKLAPEACALTAFNGNGVHYEYVVLPFGPKNGPAAFARFIYKIVGEPMQREGKPVLIFFDDIIIGGTTFHEHMTLVAEVLRRLENHGVVVKTSKARIAMAEIECLGFIVGREGVKPDPAKVQAIRAYPRPQTQSQLRAFLGLLNFYGSMVPHLQSILRPLNKALQPDAGSKSSRVVVWDEAMGLAFANAKDVFAKAVLTQLPDFSRPFIVKTDASEVGLGACLSQRTKDGVERPIAFYSKGMDAQMGDPEAAAIKTRELELYAFLLASRKWRHYLYGRSFEWHTDHKPLLWDEKEPTKKVLNWLAELKELDFRAVYVKGEKNVVADALSRQPSPEQPVATVATVMQAARVFVPADGREEVLLEYHDRRGHPGVSKTLEFLRKHFVWPQMKKDVRRWCSSCDACQRVHAGGTTELSDEVTSQPERPLDEITMDLVKIEERQLLVIECALSRFVEAYLLPSKAADGVHRAYMSFMRRYGTPHVVRSDNGLEFTTLDASSTELGFEWIRSSPHNPRSNGKCERANQTLLKQIVLLREDKFSLEEAVELGVSLYNNQVHTATGQTPYSLVFGKAKNEPDLVVEQRRAHRVNPRSKTAKWARERAQRDREAFQKAVARDRRQKEARTQVRDTPRFKVGDLVLIPRTNRKKTESRWQGPYEVTQVREGGTYRLKNVNKFRDRQLRHHRLLRPYVQREGVAPGLSRDGTAPERESTRTQAVRAPPGGGAAALDGGGECPTDTHEEQESESGEEEKEEEFVDVASDMENLDAEESGSESLHTWSSEKEEPVLPLAIPAKDVVMRDLRKKTALDRRPADIDDEALVRTRRSQRKNLGVPPRKYIMDSIQSALARIERIATKLGNWSRSHDPVKQMALALVKRREAIPV